MIEVIASNKGYLIDKIHTYIISVQNFAMIISLFGLLGITSYMAIKGSITLGGVILIINNMEKIMMPIMNLGNGYLKFYLLRNYLKKLMKLLKTRIIMKRLLIYTDLNIVLNLRMFLSDMKMKMY